ncbi:unnamed protein product [Rotaria sp. Silwood1]|nr:unnamed protein product [Rotaria sp. Silwood1]
MITLEEAIDQVQMIGAMKYPYLKKLKPICTEDFVNEVIREVFNRLGTIITLDMVEIQNGSYSISSTIIVNICSDSTKNHLLKSTKSKSHFAETFIKDQLMTVQQHKSTKELNSTNVSLSTLVSFDTNSTEKCPLMGIEQKINSILESTSSIAKAERNKRKPIVQTGVQEQVKNQNQEIIKSLTVGMCYCK